MGLFRGFLHMANDIIDVHKYRVPRLSHRKHQSDTSRDALWRGGKSGKTGIVQIAAGH
jgi:hypothetical protein